MVDTFKLKSEYKPAGDQPKAIEALMKGLKRGERHQTLLGVTGSGKTFTVANVIAHVQKPTLVIAHNKTLAAQLTQEYREFFPENSVQYFVSYYDYYQPEAYMPHSDTYIEKEAQINAEIDRLRHASTQALLTRKDVIIVASVSAIYGLGSPDEYEKVHKKIAVGEPFERSAFMRALISLQFERTNADLTAGTFRAVGPAVEVMPVNETVVYRIRPEGGKVGHIARINAVSRAIIDEPNSFYLFPAKHYVTPEGESARAVKDIEDELALQLKKFEAEGKLLEAERLKRRTRYDLALIREIGYCNGIENYSRHFDGRTAGEPPYSLLSYFPTKRRITQTGRGQTQTINEPDFLTIIDESHVTIPQIGGMYAGDQSRKKTLIEHGFRLPSAADNRPLTFAEFEERVGATIYTSATPGPYELEKSCPSTRDARSGLHDSFCEGVVQQVIRPTGLVDPEIILRPVTGHKRDSEKSVPYMGQISDFIKEVETTVKSGGRVLVTTLTKKMAEDLSEFLKEKGVKAEYLHSDVKTMDRITILTEFRKGKFDCLVGVNLLREGLNLPEVELVGILDADKEGFLRSETSLIQTMGRAARNIRGRVILYADQMTGSLDRAIAETARRRTIQLAYNKKHNIMPKSITKKIKDITETLQREETRAVEMLLAIDMAALDGDVKALQTLIARKREQMGEAASELDFETAAIVRDEIAKLETALSSGKPTRKRRRV